MKKLLLLFALLFATHSSFCQQKNVADKQKIKIVVSTFMKCLIKKDSIKFYSLFHTEPVVWSGVFKTKTQQDRLKKDPTKKDHFGGTYKQFYRSISDQGADEEKFYNIEIINDESIASVTFDYSFWENKKKINWGKESWGLVKINGEWKITSVIFSLEFEDINPENTKSKKTK